MIRKQHMAERMPSGMESVSCLFCAQDDSFPAIQENGFTGRKCRRCGLIYISPRPSRTEVANLYGHDQASISAAAHVAAGHYKRLHARHTLGILRRYVTKGQLLEIGPGAGFFLREALAAGFQPYGIELNPRQIEFIRARGIPCSSETIAEAFPGQSFEVIYHCDVLSHLHDPLAEFDAMHRRLRDGGILMFETGNFGDVRVDRLSWVPRFQYPDHLFFFSTDNIRELLARPGFELLKIYRYSLLADLFRWKLTSGIRALGKSHQDADHGKDDSVLQRSAIKAHVEFLCRYRIGALFPLQNYHQTMIVLARKS